MLGTELQEKIKMEKNMKSRHWKEILELAVVAAVAAVAGVGNAVAEAHLMVPMMETCQGAASILPLSMEVV